MLILGGRKSIDGENLSKKTKKNDKRLKKRQSSLSRAEDGDHVILHDFNRFSTPVWNADSIKSVKKKRTTSLTQVDLD